MQIKAEFFIFRIALQLISQKHKIYSKYQDLNYWELHCQRKKID